MLGRQFGSAVTACLSPRSVRSSEEVVGARPASRRSSTKACRAVEPRQVSLVSDSTVAGRAGMAGPPSNGRKKTIAEWVAAGQLQKNGQLTTFLERKEGWRPLVGLPRIRRLEESLGHRLRWPSV
jgi:hypothetical protein